MLNQLNQEQRQWVEEIYSRLSEDEKIGQLVNVPGRSLQRSSVPVEEWLKKYPVGSIFTGSEIIDSFAAGAGGTTSLQDAVSAAGLTVPMLFSGDFENGIGGQIEGFTTMPRTMGLAATFSEQDSYDFGKVIGTEGRALDIRWAFGPVSDLNLNRENPVTNIRSAGDNPDYAVKILKNIVKGMQDQGVAACPKHFPGDGTDTRNQHFVTSHNVLSKEEWDRMHGRVFRELIEAGAMSIMIGHLAFPAYEPMDEGKGKWRPATCSRRILTDLLRGELGFKGIILTDALSMNGYLSWGDYEERILDSFNAGVDVFLWPGEEKFFPLIRAALRDGRISRERFEDSVKRILAFKALLGLNKPVSKISKEKLDDLLQENHKIAWRIGENSITLLRNRDHVLPLQLPEKARILVLIAPDKPAPWKYLRKFIDRLEKRGCEVTAARSADYPLYEKIADVFDAVFYLSDANPQYNEYRAFDMIYWGLMSCPKINKLIMISFGTPYMLYDVAEAATYINAYHDCEASVDATVRAIFGEIPFKGKSPVSVKNCFSLGDGLSC